MKTIRTLQKILRSGLLSLTLALSLMLSSVMVNASSLPDGLTDEETTEDSAEDTEYSRLRGSHLNFGTVKISQLASNEINIYGLTECNHVSEKVWLSLALERKVDGSYQTYKMWDFTDENVSNLDISINVLVPSGTYYRLRGYHAAAADGIKESTTTITYGILVD